MEGVLGRGNRGMEKHNKYDKAQLIAIKTESLGQEVLQDKVRNDLMKRSWKTTYAYYKA